ncbi:MAG TPA: histidine phosphatase family protein, partial [Thermodesulfobacteriota bacterium]|nr:histidine phosphatase family protein [Thermodesulfobacteriota bacterium]
GGPGVEILHPGEPFCQQGCPAGNEAMIEESTKTRIFLIRHGETEWNRIGRFQGRSDTLLNEKGREQARSLALRLKDETITAIYTSPLARAVEMARTIGAFHPSVPIIEEAALLEMALGEFEGLEGKAWAEKFPDFRKAWRENPASVAMPGGEDLASVQARGVALVKRLCASHKTGTLLLSGHNFVNAAIICYAQKLPLDRFREVKQASATLNILWCDGEKMETEAVNDCGHLKTT